VDFAESLKHALDAIDDAIAEAYDAGAGPDLMGELQRARALVQRALGKSTVTARGAA